MIERLALEPYADRRAGTLSLGNLQRLVGRGFIAPLAWTVAMVAVSQVLAVLGWGAWFPWSVPAILAGAGGTQVEPVALGGIVVVAVVAVAGLVCTIAWWDRADQTG